MPELRRENRRAWDIVGRCMLAWFVCAFSGLLLLALWPPLGFAVIAVGFGWVGYAGFVVHRYTRMQRRVFDERDAR